MKTEPNAAAHTLVAMSGGVDSSVAAFLLAKQGHTCVGVTLRLLDKISMDEPKETTGSDTDDARRVAEQLGIPHYVLNLSDVFEREVMRRFADGYICGVTPNPCVDCNRFVKFGDMWRHARTAGAALATGHYARVERDPVSGLFLLKKAVDAQKDQSYMLYALPQTVLAHVLFPLGALTKTEVRTVAAEQGFVNAAKRESQDICFVPDGDHTAFIERYTGRSALEGVFIDAEGCVLGRHKGLVRYTIGQRKGLGIALQKPMYVCEKDVTHNTVTLCENEALFTCSLDAAAFNWIIRKPEDGSFRAAAKIRYRQMEQPAVITPTSNDTAHIQFDSPQRAIAKGQAVVVYDGDIVVGGGTIL